MGESPMARFENKYGGYGNILYARQNGDNMFDNYSSCQNNKINAVAGAILKNHPKSWFERFHLKSQRANKLLYEGNNKNIIVLQMVICGDMEVIAECVYCEDYEQKIETE